MLRWILEEADRPIAAPNQSTAFESAPRPNQRWFRGVEFEKMSDLSRTRKETGEVTRAKDYYARHVRTRMAAGLSLIDIRESERVPTKRTRPAGGTMKIEAENAV